MSGSRRRRAETAGEEYCGSGRKIWWRFCSREQVLPQSFHYRKLNSPITTPVNYPHFSSSHFLKISARRASGHGMRGRENDRG